MTSIYAPFAKAQKARAEDWADDFDDARQIDQALRLGEEAKRRGESKDENPYNEGALHDAWNEGWERG
jgi:hypothetical protein